MEEGFWDGIVPTCLYYAMKCWNLACRVDLEVLGTDTVVEAAAYGSVSCLGMNWMDCIKKSLSGS
jgi:hypothetical protein